MRCIFKKNKGKALIKYDSKISSFDDKIIITVSVNKISTR